MLGDAYSANGWVLIYEKPSIDLFRLLEPMESISRGKSSRKVGLDPLLTDQSHDLILIADLLRLHLQENSCVKFRNSETTTRVLSFVVLILYQASVFEKI